MSRKAKYQIDFTLGTSSPDLPLKFTKTSHPRIVSPDRLYATDDYPTMTPTKGDLRDCHFLHNARKSSENIGASYSVSSCDYYVPNTGEKKELVLGLGGGYRFCVLGHTLFDQSGRVVSEVGFSDLAQHVFFTETGEPLTKLPNGKRSPLIGTHNGVALYLLFNGILGDKRTDAGNILTSAVLRDLPKHDGPRVIFGEGCRLGSDRLKRERITFKQIPYEIKVS